MARSTPARGSASKSATSPYFDKGKGKSSPATTSSTRSSARRSAAATTPTGKAKKAAIVYKDDDDDEEDESSETSSEESGAAGDDYQEPDSDAIDEESETSDTADVDDEDEEDEAVLSEDIDGDVLDFSKDAKPQKGGDSKKRKDKSKGSGSSPVKRAKKDDSDFDENEGGPNPSDEDDEEVIVNGRKVTRTKLVAAPSSSVKPGIIDLHTMQFLVELKKNNERDWFAKHDARYRHALKNWQDFVTEIQTEFAKGDWTIPEMPAKDLIHRIYRDVRFSNDKTPYKTNFGASFSRAGRKGPFAGYYLQISPGRSLLAGGKWGPEKNDLATIRSNILRSSKPLRKVINAPKFVEMFGPAKPDGKGKGQRCNVYGADDALKIAPKINGVDKTHKDIDLLKLRTIGVVYNFKDEDVTKPDFRTKVGEVIAAMSPLVLLLNDMLHPQSDNEEGQEEEESEDDEPAEEEKLDVTAASARDEESAMHDEDPAEEDDSDGQEGAGGIEDA